MWMKSAGLGLPVIFYLLRTVDAGLFPTLMNLIMQTSPSWGAAELEMLVAFVVGAQVSEAVRVQVLELMIQLWTQRTVSIEHMRGGGGQPGFDYIFSIVDTDSEDLRCLALRALAMMLDCPKCQKAFAKCNGFDVLSRLLRSKHFTAHTPTTLLQMALGSFRVEGAAVGGGGGSSGGGGGESD